MITQEELKRLLDYDEETGVFTWKVANSKRVKIGQVAGALDTMGYRQITVNHKIYLGHRLAWLYIEGYLPLKNLDHIDGVKNNNARRNLREASRSENCFNQGKQRNNTSGFKGVTWNKKAKKW